MKSTATGAIAGATAQAAGSRTATKADPAIHSAIAGIARPVPATATAARATVAAVASGATVTAAVAIAVACRGVTANEVAAPAVIASAVAATVRSRSHAPATEGAGTEAPMSHIMAAISYIIAGSTCKAAAGERRGARSGARSVDVASSAAAAAAAASEPRQRDTAMQRLRADTAASTRDWIHVLFRRRLLAAVGVHNRAGCARYSLPVLDSRYRSDRC